MTRLTGFPDYSALRTSDKIADLERLAEDDLTKNEYVNGKGISKLLAVLLDRYRLDRDSSDWLNDPFIAGAKSDNRCFHLFLAAIFDLATNIEYTHGRLVNSKWIYCNGEDGRCPTVFYSFLKQCPRCCLEKGLEPRLSGAQHKPSSHHIGEISTTITVLLLRLLGEGNSSRMSIATITKQSHDVDAIGYRDGLITLFEIKSSPMVTFPLSFELQTPLVKQGDDGIVAYAQHQLIDVVPDLARVSLELPHRATQIPLCHQNGDKHWPFEAAHRAFGGAHWVRTYFSAWLELFNAYSVPKTQRTAAEQALTYLVNGWGDEIDSNKTKPGLGRTDDIKKGTYQLLKFGAYYNDEDAALKIRGVLVANLDPLFLKSAYFDGIKNLRWGDGERFKEDGDHYRIQRKYLHYLYSAVVAFNEPVVNDDCLADTFNIEAAETALLEGRIDRLLGEWQQVRPAIT